ncbi:hypothetical protein Tco_0831309 [Tanacetum coccineum]
MKAIRTALQATTRTKWLKWPSRESGVEDAGLSKDNLFDEKNRLLHVDLRRFAYRCKFVHTRGSQNGKTPQWHSQGHLPSIQYPNRGLHPHFKPINSSMWPGQTCLVAFLDQPPPRSCLTVMVL